MARIRKPKILLMAPTALGPSRRTSGPPSPKKRVTLRASRSDADHHSDISGSIVHMSGQRHDHADRARP